jgi:hypothetical protein
VLLIPARTSRGLTRDARTEINLHHSIQWKIHTQKKINYCDDNLLARTIRRSRSSFASKLNIPSLSRPTSTSSKSLQGDLFRYTWLACVPFPTNFRENLHDKLPTLCTRFRKQKSLLCRERFRLLPWNRTCFVAEIQLVSDESDNDSGVSLTLKLFNPAFRFIQGRLYGSS